MDITGLKFSSTGSGSVRPEPPQNAQNRELREAVQAFEGLFVKQLFSNIDIASPMSGQGGAQTDFLNNMWRDQIAKQVTSGDGLGLSQLMMRQLGQPGSSGLQRQMAAYTQHAPEPKTFTDPASFVQHVRPHIEKAAQDLGISPKILLAQAALETGWGRHMPADTNGQGSRNLFGIKAHGNWQGNVVKSETTEFYGEQAQRTESGFRAYENFADSVRDYVDFLRENPRYQNALQHGGSDKNFLQGLKFAGYATDPQYVEKVIDVAQSPALSQYWDAI